MKSDPSPRAAVAIIGGGFSGTMVAAQLARRGLSSVLVDGSGRIGKGVAYSTREPAHVLNVRAEVMSAWPDDPDDFSRAIEAEGGSAKDFAQRRTFGAYLGGILASAVASGDVRTISAMAVAAEPNADGWAVRLDDGRTVEVGALVLANGNQKPAPMAIADGVANGRFVGNPWGGEAGAMLGRLAGGDGEVLLLGTGLTAVDQILSLDANGHRGRIVALSRRGQLPRGHLPHEPAPVAREEVPMGRLMPLWRWLRRRSAEVGWRGAVDSLRPHSSAIWQSLDESEKRRFLRHARPWWDVHRHRIATEVAERLRQMIGEGRVEVVAGRIRSMRPEQDGIAVEIARRGRPGSEERHFVAAFNCTGPLGAMSRTADPLLRQMLDEGLVAADPLDLGLDVDARDRAGRRVWALGPLTKGRYWEIVAVPDIRGQAAAVAADIATELG